MNSHALANAATKLRRIIGELDVLIEAIDEANKVQPTEPETVAQRKAGKMRRRLNEARLHLRDAIPTTMREDKANV